jgi:hypothetical protein
MKILYLVILINICLCIDHYTSASEALKNYPKQTKKGGKVPKFIYFKMRPESCRNMDYYSRIFYNYLNTVGVRPYFSKIENNLLLGMVPVDAEIDLDALKDNFSDLVEDIYIKYRLE